LVHACRGRARRGNINWHAKLDARIAMLSLRSTGHNFNYGRSDRPSATCVLVSFSQFFFHLPFPFLLSRVPHFLPFPPPDLQRRRREAARALPTAHSAANVQRLPPTPNLFLSFPIHLFLLHCLPSPRFSWHRQELSRSAPIVRCCSPRRRGSTSTRSSAGNGDGAGDGVDLTEAKADVTSFDRERAMRRERAASYELWSEHGVVGGRSCGDGCSDSMHSAYGWIRQQARW